MTDDAATQRAATLLCKAYDAALDVEPWSLAEVWQHTLAAVPSDVLLAVLTERGALREVAVSGHEWDVWDQGVSATKPLAEDVQLYRFVSDVDGAEPSHEMPVTSGIDPQEQP